MKDVQGLPCYWQRIAAAQSESQTRSVRRRLNRLGPAQTGRTLFNVNFSPNTDAQSESVSEAKYLQRTALATEASKECGAVESPKLLALLNLLLVHVIDVFRKLHVHCAERETRRVLELNRLITTPRHVVAENKATKRSKFNTEEGRSMPVSDRTNLGTGRALWRRRVQRSAQVGYAARHQQMQSAC